MVTIGTQGTCKFCGCQTMEDEIRYSECRAECPECGLYYESGFVSRILPYYLPEPEQHPFLATLYHAFQADGWHITDTRCFRIGVIHRPLSPAHCFYILNSWFTVPTPLIAPKIAIRCELSNDRIKLLPSNRALVCVRCHGSSTFQRERLVH